MDENQIASLQAAMKQAIQTVYQLEDSELAAEPLPNMDDRRVILLYEAAEGGAGVLRHLISGPRAFAAVAKEALEICHFDAATGQDRRRAPRATEDCEAACYDCLMTYSNQRDHGLLDRMSIRDFLLQCRGAVVSGSPSVLPRAEHLNRLMNQAGSTLEKGWLTFVDERDLNLPSKAQYLMQVCSTRPDFFYEDQQVAVYIDGPFHDYPERAQRDQEQTHCLEDLGYTVIRFGHQDDWENIFARFPHVFGAAK